MKDSLLCLSAFMYVCMDVYVLLYQNEKINFDGNNGDNMISIGGDKISQNKKLMCKCSAENVIIYAIKHKIFIMHWSGAQPELNVRRCNGAQQ